MTDGDTFTLSADDVRSRNAQLRNELKAEGRNGRRKAKSPSLETCGCPFSLPDQRLCHDTRAVDIKTATGPWWFGAATAGGFERSSITMHDRHTMEAVRRDAQSLNNRAHSAAPHGRVEPTSAKAAKAGAQPGTTTTAGRSNVELPEFHPPTLLGGVAGGGCFFIKNTPTPATPSCVRGIREMGVVA
jgi:hypothetical protein